MTTRLGSTSQRRRFVAIGASLLSIVLIAGAQTALAADEDRIPQEDAATLFELRVGEPPAATKLTKEDALARARELYGEDAMGATQVDAYLESLTLENTLRTPEAIVDRPAWIVHMSGMGIVEAGPITEDGPAASTVVDNLYVFIDANTGEFLMGIWTE